MATCAYLSLLLVSLTLFSAAPALGIGVNYGTLGDNLPPPSQVAHFLKTRTIVDSVKLFDANAEILRAFADTGISVTISTYNHEITSLTNLDFAKQWVANNVSPYHPRTIIRRILVGNEILLTNNRDWMYNLVPAMRTLHQALALAGIRNIQVTTPHYLGVLRISEPPSAAQFRYEQDIFVPMLRFLRETRSPFMFNPYPYFAYSPAKGNYALFRRNPGVRDPYTKITYANMYEAMLDSVHSAMKRVGFGDIDIVVGETGWPTKCEPNQLECNTRNAAWFNRQVILRSQRRLGTPLMPNRRFETYVFSLFNENMKPGPTTERNWGLFRHDLSPVYDAGILRQNGGGGRHRPMGKRWCVPKPGVAVSQLQANINYACSQVNCRPIQNGGVCFSPNDVRSHAAFAMNSFYQTHGRRVFTCDFSGSGQLTTINPSIFHYFPVSFFRELTSKLVYRP